MSVARMERSVIRGQPMPDYAALHPGYKSVVTCSAEVLFMRPANRSGPMTDAAPRRWSIEEFFAWQERQPERYELVDGFPIRMMAGAKNVHDDIVVNILAELRNQLRGVSCRPFTSDGSVETKPGQIRRPDVGVDC